MVSLIKELLDWQQLSPTQFADRIGIGRPVISHILSERNKPSLEVIRSIKVAFPTVSTDWLLSGSGPMLAAEAAATPSPTAGSEASPNSAAAAPLPTGTSEITPAHPETPLEAMPPLGLPQAAAAATSPAAPSEIAEPLPALPALTRFKAGKSTAPAAPPPTEAALLADVAAAPAVRVAEEAAPASETAPFSPSAAARFVAPVAVAGPAPHLAASSAAAPAPFSPASHAASDAAVLAQGLAEPGKAIRRIVIFYRDGSFADYQPE